MEWYKGKICKVERFKPKPDEVKIINIKYYVGDENGYHENDVLVSFKKNGAVTFNDETDGFIYLYPEQVKFLTRILNVKN